MENHLYAKAKSLGAAREVNADTKQTSVEEGSRRLTRLRPNPSHPMKGKKGRRQQQGAGSQPEFQNLGYSDLPQYVAAPIYRKKVHWAMGAGALSLTAFTLSDGHNQFLVTTNTTGTLVPYADAWRIRAIDIYLKDSSSDETVLVTFQPSTNTTDNFLEDLPRTITMESAGSASYARYRIKPNSSHPIGAWHKTSSTNQSGTLFSMATTGAMKVNCCYLDIEFDFILNVSGTVPGYVITGTGTTIAGELYVHSLFGTNFVVQGQNAIV